MKTLFSVILRYILPPPLVWKIKGQVIYKTGSVDEIRLWNTTVPEPSTTTLLIGGCGSLLLFRRRKTNTTI